MFKKTIILASCLLFGGLANAGAEDKLESAEFEMIEIRWLSALQIQKLLVGHTYPLSKGEIYFPSTSNAILAWDGMIEHTSWHATDNSQFCYVRNGEDVCLGLRKGEGESYVQDYNGEETVIPSELIVKGKVFHSYFR